MSENLSNYPELFLLSWERVYYCENNIGFTVTYRNTFISKLQSGSIGSGWKTQAAPGGGNQLLEKASITLPPEMHGAVIVGDGEVIIDQISRLAEAGVEKIMLV